MITPKHSHWPRAPLHKLSASGVYMVTAGTFRKSHLYNTPQKLKGLHDGLLKYANKHLWQLEAWAVFPNHYHFIARSPEDLEEGGKSLVDFISEFHRRSATWLNRVDETPGRKVWHNFWDSRITYEKSYFARLNYVHQNALKHGLVKSAADYPYCSAAWFESTASPATVKTIYSFPIDRVNVIDDFGVR